MGYSLESTDPGKFKPSTTNFIFNHPIVRRQQKLCCLSRNGQHCSSHHHKSNKHLLNSDSNQLTWKHKLPFNYCTICTQSAQLTVPILVVEKPQFVNIYSRCKCKSPHTDVARHRPPRGGKSGSGEKIKVKSITILNFTPEWLDEWWVTGKFWTSCRKCIHAANNHFGHSLLKFRALNCV